MWNINKAIVIGRDHELYKKNRQDFCDFGTNQNAIVGVVCDGCGESEFSEVGACLSGNFILNTLLSNTTVFNENFISNFTEIFNDFIELLLDSVFLTGAKLETKIKFVDSYLLSTFIFCVIKEDKIHIGRCGDGVVGINENVSIINQDGKPHYMAYNYIPKEALLTEPSKLEGIQLSSYDIKDVNRVVIATDGLNPLIEKNMTSELFNTQKRQLQRKFNVFSGKEKLFYDDTSCIVFEKVTDESIIPESNN